jgi:hypothetical protein
MKNFVSSVLYISIAFLVVVLSLEFFFKDNFNFINYKFQLLREDKSSSILILGNSHAMALRKPSINGMDAFNFGVGGQDVYHIYLISKQALATQDKNKIKYIIVGLDYHLMGYDFKIANTLWMDRLYYPDTKTLLDNSMGGRILALSNFFRANRNFKEAIKSFSFVENDKKKIGANSKLSKIDENFAVTNSSCQERSLEHSVHKYNPDLIDSNYKHLKELISLCKKHNVKLILLNFPKKSCYYSYYDSQLIKQVVPKINQLVKGTDVKFIDCWKSEKFNDSMFVDNDHFNPLGTETMVSVLSEFMPKR